MAEESLTNKYASQHEEMDWFDLDIADICKNKHKPKKYREDYYEIQDILTDCEIKKIIDLW